MDFLLKRIEQILRYQKRWKKWQKVVASLACVVVFITTYALILPAITMDRDEAQSQGGIFWEESQEAEETVASADEQGTSQDGILSAEQANLTEEPVEDGNEDQVIDNNEQYPSDGTEEQVGTGIALGENPAEGSTPDSDLNIEKPAAVFDEVAGDVTVHVEAPEGAFPAGTTMRVEPVADEQVMDAVQEAVEESVTKVSAVDIIFLDALGNEIEPAAEIKVSMSSTVMQNVEQPVIVHVDEEGVGETVESEQVDGAVVFESDRFSVYVLVETELYTEIVLPGSTDTYAVTVYAPAEAKIPQGSALKVEPFDEGSEEFEHARNAVLADKKEKGEHIDITSFNFAALDISIINPEGNEIEPSSTVVVDIKVKKLPGVENLEEIVDSLEIQHHVETANGVVIEKVLDGKTEGTYEMATETDIASNGVVVDPDSVSDEDFWFVHGGVEDVIDASFEVEDFSTFSITWGQRNTTVHYGFLENGIFVEFSAPVTETDYSTNYYEYLIRDFDGYVYSGNSYYRTSASTRPATGGTRIQPLLAYRNNHWRYHNYSTEYSDDDWNALSNRSHIYVLYDKSTIQDGGKPKPKPVSPGEEPDPPSILKESKTNGDGTTDLSLSIRGSTVEQKVEKLADVIVVFDVSGSMNDNMDGGSATYWNPSRLSIAKTAVNNLVDVLTDKKDTDGNPLIRMSLITFSTNAQEVKGLTDLTTSGVNSYKNAVTGLSAEGGTNWEKALRIANETEIDPDRATFVIFVSDGDPTYRESRQGAQDNEIQWYNRRANYLLYNVIGQGNDDYADRNYNAALEVAQSIVQHKKNFYTIGISNDVTNMARLNSEAGGQGNFNANTSDQLEHAFDEIAESIQAMMGVGDINMTDGITDLSNTVMESASLLGVSDDFRYWKAPAPTNWNEMTAAQKEAYKPADSAFVEWNPSTEKCEEASYNTQSGAVEWKMGSDFVPQDGCTYKVTFSVWPSQDAYDWIADLKNGTKTWNDVVAAGIDYPNGTNPQIVNNGDGTYRLATNKPGANTTYKSATKSGDTVTTTGEDIGLDFNTVGPMGLSDKQMTVRKRFSHNINSVSPLTKIQFTLLEDTVAYKQADGSDYTIVLPTADGAQPNELEKWESNVYIAPGLIKTTTGEPGYQVLEKGHDYSLTEDILVGESYEYLFTSQIVRPMVVGTELKYFVKKDTEYNTNPDRKKEYAIDGGIYYELDEDSQALTGTNRKTSELDITKKINDPDNLMSDEQENAETFTYKITLTVPEGADTTGIMAYEYVPRLTDTPPHISGDPNRPRFYLFGYQDVDVNYTDVNGNRQTQKKDTDLGFADDVSKFHGKVYGGWNAYIHNLFGESDTATFYMTLDNDEVIRLTNLPQGTQYTITEYYANVNKSDQGAPTPSSDRASNVEAQGYTVSVRQDKSPNAVQTDTITGTITELDKRYYNQFTNTIGKYVDVELKARKHLDGYVWSNEQYYINLTTDEGNQLPGASGRTRFYRQFAAGTAGDADQDGYTFGKVRFTQPGTYNYYIAEDLPGQIVEGIIHDSSKMVKITIGENTDGLYVESVEGEDTTWNPSTMTSMTTITNSRITAKAKVKKIGDSNTDNPLSNVSFELYSTYVSPGSDQNVKAKKADGTEYGTLTTLTDGTFNLEGLIPSTSGTKYYLVETVAKPGYNLLSSPVEITVYLAENEPYYTVSYMQENYSISTDAGRIGPDESGYCNIVVDNKSGAELPHTGGSGTLPYTLGGIALIMASALMYGFRMRRGERRFN